MPIYNKVQLQFLLENLANKTLPNFDNLEDEADFISHFLAVIEKVIGHHDLDIS